jgi:pilus assembly protein Flp/PilA
MNNLFARFIKEEEGQDLIEYALLGGLITLLVITSITTIGKKVANIFTGLSTLLPS